MVNPVVPDLDNASVGNKEPNLAFRAKCQFLPSLAYPFWLRASTTNADTS